MLVKKWVVEKNLIDGKIWVVGENWVAGKNWIVGKKLESSWLKSWEVVGKRLAMV